MRKITRAALRRMVAEHRQWLDSYGALGERIDLSRHVIRKENLAGCNLSKGIFIGTRFYGNDLKEVKFTGADLTNAYFGPSNLSKASFKRANLTKTNFREANLSGTNFHEAIFVKTDFNNTVLGDALLDTSVRDTLVKKVLRSLDNKKRLDLVITNTVKGENI